MKKQMTRIVLGVALLAFIGGCSDKKNDREIRLGYISDLSGIAAYWGKQGLVGARLAVKEASESGIPVSLIEGDSAFSPQMGLSEVNKMLFSDHVDALVVEFTPVVLATAPIAKREKKLFFGSTPATSFLKDNPSAFKGYLDYEAGCQQIAAHWQKQGKRKIATLRVASEAGELCAQGARKIIPDLLELVFTSGEELGSYFLSLKAKEVDALLLIGFEGDWLNSIKNLRALQYSISVGGADHDFVPEKTSAAVIGVISELVCFGFSPLGAEFEKRLLQFDPQNPETGRENARLIYLHTRQLITALRTCGRSDLDCQARIMEQSPVDEAFGFLGFREHRAVYQSPLSRWRGSDGIRESLSG